MTEFIRNRLAAISDRADAATAGPWEAERDYELAEGCRCLSCFEPIEGRKAIHDLDTLRETISPVLRDADADFIAAARTDVPRLVAALRAVVDLADKAPPELSTDPLDCTYACNNGPCNCSGKMRVLSWDLKPDDVRAAIAAALAPSG